MSIDEKAFKHALELNRGSTYSGSDPEPCFREFVRRYELAKPTPLACPLTDKEKRRVRTTVGAMHHPNQNGQWQDWWKNYVKWALQYLDETKPTPSPGVDVAGLLQMQFFSLMKQAGYNADEVHPTAYANFGWSQLYELLKPHFCRPKDNATTNTLGDDVVERVAIRLSQWRMDTNLGSPRWHELSEYVKEKYRDQAKAAIAAMPPMIAPQFDEISVDVSTGYLGAIKPMSVDEKEKWRPFVKEEIQKAMEAEQLVDSSEPWPVCGKCDRELWKKSFPDGAFYYEPCSQCGPAPKHICSPDLDEEELALLITPIIQKASGQDVHPANVGRRVVTELLPHLRLTKRESSALAEAARIYFDRYMQDEADSADNCTCGEQQHRDAIAVRDALSKIEGETAIPSPSKADMLAEPQATSLATV